MTKEVFVERLRTLQKELKNLVTDYYSDKDATHNFVDTEGNERVSTHHVSMTAFAGGSSWILASEEDIESACKAD